MSVCSSVNGLSDALSVARLRMRLFAETVTSPPPLFSIPLEGGGGGGGGGGREGQEEKKVARAWPSLIHEVNEGDHATRANQGTGLRGFGALCNEPAATHHNSNQQADQVNAASLKPRQRSLEITTHPNLRMTRYWWLVNSYLPASLGGR